MLDEIEALRRFCMVNGMAVRIDPRGIVMGEPQECPRDVSAAELCRYVLISEGKLPAAQGTQLHAEGYEALATVLQRAFNQAAHGKGKERHANGEPFTEQVMQDMARRFGVGALLGQAFKKSEESQRLPHDRAVNELLGAINYLAGAVIAMERKHSDLPPAAANDNQRQAVARNA